MNKPKRHLAGSKRHASQCHRRWLERHALHRDVDAAGAKAHWSAEQCGFCAFFVRLRGALASDWGACTHSASALDGTLRFEHDGCDQHVPAVDGWKDVPDPDER